MEKVTNSIRKCPKCKSKEVVKNGFNKGKQTYKCKICKRSFFAEIKKERITKNKFKSQLKENEYLIFKQMVIDNNRFIPPYKTICKQIKITRQTLSRWAIKLRKEGVKIEKRIKNASIHVEGENKKIYAERYKLTFG